MEDFTFNPPTQEEKDQSLRQTVLYHVADKMRPAEEIVADAKRLYDFVKTGN